jgi:hypothetical protein
MGALRCMYLSIMLGLCGFSCPICGVTAYYIGCIVRQETREKNKATSFARNA